MDDMTEKIIEKNDVFGNLDALKIDQDYSQKAPAKKLLVTIPVKKPDKQAFVRVCPEPEQSIHVGLIQVKQRSETYLVTPNLLSDLSKEIVACKIFLSTTRNGELFLWPVVFPSENAWHRSAMQAVDTAKTKWVRVVTNHSIPGYELLSPYDKLPDPEWPDMPFNDILRIAFSNRIIESVDHPIVKELRGQA